jgi:predicted DsbA family dithiol-disulfide isomerase
VRIERLAETYQIKLEYVDFPLHPDTPTAGMSIAALFRDPEGRARHQRSQQMLKRLAAEEGLPLGDRTMTYNSRLAQELGLWAVSQGKGAEYRGAVFHAYFVDGENISDPEVLAALAASVGLDAGEAREVLKARRFRDAVDKEWASAEASGVEAVPTFEVGGRRVVGAQPYEVLARLVEAAGAKPR